MLISILPALAGLVFISSAPEKRAAKLGTKWLHHVKYLMPGN
jgi:hypothetical protein